MHFGRKIIGCGALSMMLSVILGAVGAHLLAGVLSERWLQVYQTAVSYQIYHSLGLMFCGLLLLHYSGNKALNIAAVLMAVGIILFSGSLYLLVLWPYPWLGILTPVGGVCWIIAWALLAWVLIKPQRTLRHK